MKGCSRPASGVKCPGMSLGQENGGDRRAEVLSNLSFLSYLIYRSFTVSTHDCRIRGTKQRRVALQLSGHPPACKTFSSQTAVAVLRKRVVYTRFCGRKNLWSGEVRNAFVQIFDVWHTALCVLAKFC